MFINARATATRCFSPPDNSAGLLIALAAGGGFYFFIQQKNKKQAEKEAIDPDADYTEDKGSFEIPPEDDSDENTSEEQDVTPI